jgi:hypothetical protein
MFTRTILSGVFLFLIFSCCWPASSATWCVDGRVSASGDGRSWDKAFKTIQEGINRATDGDTVLVARDFVYDENVHFKGKNITLQSAPFGASLSPYAVIDGRQRGAAVTFAGTENESCVLSGFKIDNGRYGLGGGICGGSSDGDLRTRATIKNNLITGNYNSGGPGGGIAYCDGLIQNNVITGNSALGGGGLWHCFGTIENNLIYNNSVTNSGGGLAFCDGIIQNNAIYENSAAWSGGGVSWCSGTMRNCIIWGNKAAHGAQVDGPHKPTYSCIEGWSLGGEGNIAFNPHFVDEFNGDFHLTSWSPCIDAGDPTSPFKYEPQPNGGRVDMGAYGNTPEGTPRSPDTDADGLPDDWELHWFRNLQPDAASDSDADLILDITEYRYGWAPDMPSETLVENLTRGGRYQTIEAAMVEASGADEIVAYQGVYRENVRFQGKNITLRSADPLDPAVVTGTIIDANKDGCAVAFSAEEDETCILAGFTIQDGNAIEGAGICGGYVEGPRLKSTLATVRNNVILRNSARDYGGGVFMCDGAIENNVICGNSASLGGGISGCFGVIEGNTIASNCASSGGGGLETCGGTVQNNAITGNSADYGGGLNSCLGVIRNNVIARNAALYGGGVYYCGGATIRNNTIAENFGGGAYLCDGEYDETTMTNCIIWGNTGRQFSADCPATYCCIEGWTGGGEGNIAEDPQFADSDYRLRASSPCVDAGRNENWMWDAVDLDGNPRIYPAGPHWKVDMGAYEYVPSAYEFKELIEVIEGKIGLAWTVRPGQTCVVWSCIDLLGGTWAEETRITPAGRTARWFDPDATADRKFYRIEIP